MLKRFKTTALASSVALIAGFAAAGYANAANSEDAAVIQLATASNDQETTFDEQKKAIEETFDSWTNQIAEHAEAADENAQDVAEDAGEALDEAWVEVQNSWSEVQEASEENWEEAKAKFDESVKRLEAAWNELKGG